MPDQPTEKPHTDHALQGAGISADDDASSTEKNELQAHRTISRVPGNTSYYEVDGLRTEGDDQDHTTENKKSMSFILTITGCDMGLCASQIMSLLYLTIGTAVAEELNTDLFVWMLTASNIASGAIAPWVGPLADLVGRRTIFLWGGFGLSALASIVCAAAPNGEAFTAGQVLFGIGNVMQDLMSLAIVAESVPTNKRPMYTGIILLMIVPWAPGTLYANLLLDISFRWIGLVLALWNVIGFVVVYIAYKEPPRVNARGLTKSEMIKRIDWLGGVLITIGLVLIMVALNAGGDGEGRFPWTDSRVLVPLILGFVIFIGAIVYEYFWAPYPLFPRRIIHAPRAFICIMMVIFGAGVNYIALVVFVPIQARAVFQGDNVNVGIWMIPIGTCILGGAILSAFLLHIFKKHVQWVMWTFCVIQTISCACLVLVDPFDITTLWPPFIFALTSIGAVLVPNQVIITIITPSDLLGSVTALTVGLRAQCQAIGLAIFYNQFLGVLSTTAASPDGLTPAMLSSGVAGTLIEQGASIDEITAFATRMMNALTAMPFREYAATMPGVLDTPAAYEVLQPRVVETFTTALERLWYISIGFGVFAIVAGLFVGDLYRYQDGHVAVKMT